MSIVQLHVAYITDYINNYAAWANIHIVSFMKVLACNRDFCQQMSLPVRRKYRACIHVNNLYLPASGIDKVNKSIKYKLNEKISRYGDGIRNTTEENFRVFSIIRVHCCYQ